MINKYNCGEHYGVIDSQVNREVYCGQNEDKRFDEEKPSWLVTAQKIYPMSDDKYYKMLIAAKRSAKIELNMRNAFTSPSYQRRYIKSMGESLVIDAAITLRHCKSVCESV